MLKIVLWIIFAAAILNVYQCSKNHRLEEKKNLIATQESERSFEDKFGVHTFDSVVPLTTRKIHYHSLDFFNLELGLASIDVQDFWPKSENILVSKPLSFLSSDLNVTRLDDDRFLYELAPDFSSGPLVNAVCDQNLWPEIKQLRYGSRFGKYEPELFVYGSVVGYGKMIREDDRSLVPIDFKCDAIFLSDAALVEEYLSSLEGMKVVRRKESAHN